MIEDRDCEAEGVELDRLQRKAADKIEAQRKSISLGPRSGLKAVDQRQLLNEMQGNKASLDLNQTLLDFECDDELAK